MNLHKLITDCMLSASSNVFSTMLGQELPPGQVIVDKGDGGPNAGVVSFIGIAGAWAGTGSILCSPALACKLCNAMLMTEATSVDAEVLDSVAELTNMIIGSVKTDLERHIGPLGLSIPTVVYGHNFRTKCVGQQEWIVITYECEGEPLMIKLCLSPQQPPTHTNGNSHHYALEV
jgi:chemotaxis protein CheX